MTDVLSAAEFEARMAQCQAEGASWPGAVAVSGGSDSKALMLLLAEWARAVSRQPPVVLTVDHGLQTGSRKTADGVVKDAKRHGLSAHKLVWQGDKPKSDIEALAREARYRLMGAWCLSHGIKGLYLAHTEEDQAETFLLRLARGSGLDGLAAMRTCSPFPLAGYEGLRVVRPLLESTRFALRAYLENCSEAWSDDPMNSDPRFARVRIRQAWRELGDLGLSPARIAAAAMHLARARDALEDATVEFLDGACRFEDERVLVDGARFVAVAPEIGLRALAHILLRVSGEPYRPRFERLERLYRSLRSGTLKTARTLHGCRIGPAPKAHAIFGPFTLMIAREPARRAIRPGIAAGGQIS